MVRGHTASKVQVGKLLAPILPNIAPFIEVIPAGLVPKVNQKNM